MITRLNVATKVRENLEDSGITYYSTDDVNDAIQDGYNRYAALTGGILKGTYVPKPKTPYLKVGTLLTDYMYPVGIYNWIYNRWLSPVSLRQLDNCRLDWELWTGEMSHFSVIDFRRIVLTPYNSSATGTFFLLYKSRPPILSDGIVLQIPKLTENIIEYYATADLLEQGREYSKAQSYWELWSSDLIKAKAIVRNFAKTDRMRVMQPFFPMGYYTKAKVEDGDSMFVDNETPSGAINGVNTTFTLASSPSPANSLVLVRNGVTLFEGLGYTLSGNTINLVTALKAPTEEDTQGDKLRAWYRVA